MNRILSSTLVLALASPALRAEDKATPKVQYAKLVKEYSDLEQACLKASREAKTDKELENAAAKTSELETFAARFLELAENNPKDPVAVDALIWIANNTWRYRAGPAKKARDRSFDLLFHDHIESEKISLICQILAIGGYEKQKETFLRAVVAKNPHKEVQAEACLSLAKNLQARAGLAESLAAPPSRPGAPQLAIDNETIAELKAIGFAKLDADSAAMLRKFVEHYAGDMKPVRLAEFCYPLGHSSDKRDQSLLRILLEKDARREVKGVACLALGRSLKQQADADREKDPKAAALSQAESEKLLERAEKEFADVEVGFRGAPVGQMAKRALYELRHLSIGLQAPDVAGVDEDGKKFKLSGYKGKVVLLDFWSEF